MTDRSIVAGQCMPVSVVLLAKRTRGRPFLVFYHWESRLELETLAVFQFGLEVQVQRRERINTSQLLRVCVDFGDPSTQSYIQLMAALLAAKTQLISN